MLTAIDLDNDFRIEADIVQNEPLKWHLSSEFKVRQAAVAKETPHGRFGVGRRSAHSLCESATLPFDRPMVDSG